jgi:hypothetical protein
MEARHCKGDPERRKDDGLRMAYLAIAINNAGQLLPEHQHLLPEEP